MSAEQEVIARTCSPSKREAEAGLLGVWGQPSFIVNSKPSCIVELCLSEGRKGRWRVGRHMDRAAGQSDHSQDCTRWESADHSQSSRPGLTA